MLFSEHLLVLPFFAKLPCFYLLTFLPTEYKRTSRTATGIQVSLSAKERKSIFTLNSTQFNMYLLGTHFMPGAEPGIKEIEFVPFLKRFSGGGWYEKRKPCNIINTEIYL